MLEQIPGSDPPLDLDTLAEVWPVLDADERVEAFRQLDREDAEDFFVSRSAAAQATILRGLSPRERRLWMRLLAPDDAADLLQEVEGEERSELLDLLDARSRSEVTALMAYEEDEAGGLMSPRFVRLRPEMTIDEAIGYLRRQVRREPETLYYAYVLDSEQRLLGVTSFRELLVAGSDLTVREVMTTDVLTVPADLDQEHVARIVARSDLLAVPVVDTAGRVQGIVTVDDIVDVVQEEATEDIQKLGGMEALDLPYLQTPFLSMMRKRAGWLSVLFVGELLTASAMGWFEGEIARAVVLALFIPLIISSGGNSGSQAATLVIRAMALGEVRLRDWWRIMQREVQAGAVLGVILAALGFLRVLLWQHLFAPYGEHWVGIGFTVAVSLVGVVLWGTVTGSMLPFVIRRLGFDAASASAPFVATLVDVAGVLIYFTVARALLGGSLL